MKNVLEWIWHYMECPNADSCPWACEYSCTHACQPDPKQQISFDDLKGCSYEKVSVS